MNHILVAELLVEDAKIKDATTALRQANNIGDSTAAQDAEKKILKHNILRDLIWGEMTRTERELYELQREHHTVEKDVKSHLAI